MNSEQRESTVEQKRKYRKNTTMANTDTSEKEKLQADYLPTFARLGRSVWFTLESSYRADPSRSSGLEERLEQTASTNQDTVNLRLSWMAVGDFKTRRIWTNDQWVAFLRTWKMQGATVFVNNTEEEQKLFQAFSNYWTFFSCLPKRPENISEGETISDAGKLVHRVLGEFQDHLGDAVTPCDRCGKCALGYKLKRCSRCKQASYCSQDCQKEDWRGHKRTCTPLQNKPKELNRFVQKRFTELRRQGKDAKVAMKLARETYDMDKLDASGNAGSQVAAMFGMPM